jgi:endogenous inhibitor of DNA gyrase (YacG/DUF329 family)
MCIYLYHKRHAITGLNYFGKAKYEPIKYCGSGVYWNAHLKKHGKLIENVQIWKFEDEQERSKFAIQFSKDNDIVKSKLWANLCIEDGMMGGDKFSTMDPAKKAEHCKKQSAIVKQHWQVRSKEAQASKTANIWQERSTQSKNKIAQKISNTLLSKSETTREETLVKYRHTVSLRPTIICPHCGKSGTNIANMNRYHFDRCLQNPNMLPRKPRPQLTCPHCGKVTDPGNFKLYHGEKCKLATSDNLIS